MVNDRLCPKFTHTKTGRAVFEDRIDTSDVMSMHFSASDEETYLLSPGDILLNEGQSLELVGRSAIYLQNSAESDRLVSEQSARSVSDESDRSIPAQSDRFWPSRVCLTQSA
jgi:hypothetical protein